MNQSLLFAFFADHSDSTHLFFSLATWCRKMFIVLLFFGEGGFYIGLFFTRDILTAPLFNICYHCTLQYSIWTTLSRGIACSFIFNCEILSPCNFVTSSYLFIKKFCSMNCGAKHCYIHDLCLCIIFSLNSFPLSPVLQRKMERLKRTNQINQSINHTI